MIIVIEFASFFIDLIVAYVKWINEVGVTIFLHDALNIVTNSSSTIITSLLSK